MDGFLMKTEMSWKHSLIFLKYFLLTGKYPLAQMRSSQNAANKRINYIL